MNGDSAVSGPCTSLEHRDHGPHPDCDQPWCTCPCHTARARARSRWTASAATTRDPLDGFNCVTRFGW